jgi:L,D-peptidoglycan transpeptidase YkuD (ErfK/YbiS/YcfS/YnhG family)
MKISAHRFRTSLRWLVVLLALGALVYGLRMSLGPQIPKRFATELSDACRQAVLVVADVETSSAGKLWLLERNDASARWKTAFGPVPVAMGRNGLAWGAGEHGAASPTGFRIKKEGDGCSPAGIFRIPYAFGYAHTAPGLHLKYVPVTATLMGVDDPKSRFYNQVVDAASVERDWTSSETMLREDGLYRWGAFVSHNPANIPAGGSCIFLHIWRGPGAADRGLHCDVGGTSASSPPLARSGSGTAAGADSGGVVSAMYSRRPFGFQWMSREQ